MEKDLDLSKVRYEMMVEITDRIEKKYYEQLLEDEIQRQSEKGIELSEDEIKKLEEKYYKRYMSGSGRNLSEEERKEYFKEKERKAEEQEKQRLKKQHSIDNPKNPHKSYNTERNLCKKYLVDKSDKMYLLTTEIREVFREKSLLKFIRLMFIYEKALELGLATKSIEEAFSDYIYLRYQEYYECFEDIHKAIMGFSIGD